MPQLARHQRVASLQHGVLLLCKLGCPWARTSRIVEGDIPQSHVLAVPGYQPVVALIAPTLCVHRQSSYHPADMCIYSVAMEVAGLSTCHTCISRSLQQGNDILHLTCKAALQNKSWRLRHF